MDKKNNNDPGCLFYLIAGVIIMIVIFIFAGDDKKKVKEEPATPAPVVKKEPKKVEPRFTVQSSIYKHNKVCLIGFSSLPENVKIIFRIMDEKGNIIADDTALTDRHGKFQSKIFFSETGLKNGNYSAEAIAEDRPFIGKVTFVINKEESIRKEKEFREQYAKQVNGLKTSMCILIDELLQLKDTSDFIVYGLGAGGKGGAWKKKVEDLRYRMDRNQFSFYVPSDLRDVPDRLMQLGFDLVKTRGYIASDIQADLDKLKKLLDYDKYKGRQDEN